MEKIVQNEQIAGFLAGYTLLDFFQFLIALIIVIGIIAAVTVKAYKLLEKYRITKNELEEKEEKLKLLEQDIRQLKEHDQQNYENIKSINDKLDTVFLMFREQRQHDDENKMAELKDKISRSYRYYHEHQEWKAREKETLEGLIKSYERCGGDNSFVHSLVEKEMYTWKVVDDDE